MYEKERILNTQSRQTGSEDVCNQQLQYHLSLTPSAHPQTSLTET